MIYFTIFGSAAVIMDIVGKVDGCWVRSHRFMIVRVLPILQ